MPTLTIDAQEYRVLLEMINMATYVTQFHETGGREDWLGACDALSDKILSHAQAMGCGELVEQDSASGHWLPVEEYENESFFKECIDEMLDKCFWEELVSRLSDRDMARGLTPAQWQGLTGPEQSRRTTQRDEFYWREFETNGIDNLEIIHPAPHG